jgi:hypothetical protein
MNSLRSSFEEAQQQKAQSFLAHLEFLLVTGVEGAQEALNRSRRHSGQLGCDLTQSSVKGYASECFNS